MATAKKSVSTPAAKKTVRAAAPAKAPARKAAVAKPAATKPTAKTVAAKAAPALLKPIKTAFNKTGLLAHVAELAAVELKAVKAVLVALEATILASIHKKGLGEFTLPGLLKITAQQVPAKKKRMGKDPFTGQERMFAAKPATTKIKTRALKKLKDAAL
jgi:nucleoid DNA-binding protein